MMKDGYRKEIKRNEEMTQINIRMKCTLKEKTLQTYRLKNNNLSFNALAKLDIKQSKENNQQSFY
jgi:hypothetical protein